MAQPFPPQGTTTNHHHHFTKDLLSMDGPTMSSLFQPSAKRPRIEEVELSNNVFDDAFPLSNGHSGGGHGGGGGGGLRLSNPWLLSQMRRASLSAFVDTQAMSNMMFSGSSSSKFGGGGGSNINTMLVPTLDGPADRDEIFKTGDSVIFGNVGLGMGMNGIDSESNQLYGGNNGSSSRLLSYMDEVVGEDSSNNNKDASMSSLGHLQQQHQQHQQQQQQQYLPTAYASNKRSATAAGLDAQKHLPFMPMQATTTNEPSSVDIGMKMGGPTMMMATAPGPASGSSHSARKDENLAVSADGSSNVRFRSHQAENWTEKYETLLDYRLKNGHCLVPNQYAENPPLAEWVKRQRYQYKLKGQGKHSSMSDDRIAALEKLGFVWNSHDAVWEERLKELSQYRNIFGDTNVPSNYQPNPKLAIWVKRQRRQHKFLMESKPSTMTPHRVDKLEEIGFTWSGRKPKKALKKETWEKKCDV